MTSHKQKEDNGHTGEYVPKRIESSVPRRIALHASWDPDSSERLTLVKPDIIGNDISALVAALQSNGGSIQQADVGQNLCVALRRGGHVAAEVACEYGAVEAALTMIGDGHLLGADNVALARQATEVLWYLIDDYDSCQRLIKSRGHDALIRLAQEHGPQDVGIARNTFRLLAETLYNETRNARIWQETDVGFLVEALDWALRADMPEDGGVAVLGFVCDVVALCVQRINNVGLEMTKALVGIIPLLLEQMAARRDDHVLMQHGCRLLWALAKTSSHWPADVQQPALAALSQLAVSQQFIATPDAGSYSRLALKTVAALPAVDTSTCLHSMD